MGFRVLVAEDEAIIRRGIICSIDWGKLDCTVIDEAEDGKEACDMLESCEYDVVLMDINMPVMSGLDVLEKTYSDLGYAAVMITGYSSFDFAQQALRFGAVDYIVKPIEIEGLRQAVEKACRTRRNNLTVAEAKEKEAKTAARRSDGEADRYSVMVRSIMDYVEEHYWEKITLTMISKELFYSESYMTRSFKAETGMNFGDYLNRFRITKAIELMSTGDGARKGKIYDISVACGFSDYKYFNTVFKKYVGCSAKDFIKAGSREAVALPWEP